MISTPLILAMILAESGGNPLAVSLAGAKGLLQLTDIGIKEVAAQYECDPSINPYDPTVNLIYGVRLLTFYYEQAGTIKGALILYNSGYRGYYAWRSGEPWPEETVNYVRRVMALRWELDPSFQRILPERPRPYEEIVDEILERDSSF